MKSSVTIYTLNLLSVLLILVTGCVIQPPTTPGNSAEVPTQDQATDSLRGTKWQLTTIGQTPALPEPTVTLEFTPEGISGNAGCNSYSGAYRVTENGLAFSDTVSTTMACADQQPMEQEGRYLEQIATVSAFEVAGDQLTLFNSEGDAVLVFSAN